MPDVPWDEDDPEVEDDESENHAYEDIGRFFEARPHHRVLPAPDPLAHLDPISRQYWSEREKHRATTKKAGLFPHQQK